MEAELHIYTDAALRFVFGVFVIAAFIIFIATAITHEADDDRDL